MRILLVTLVVPQANGAGAIPTLLHAEVAALIARHTVTLVTGIAPDDDAEAAAVDALRAAGVEVHALRRDASRGVRRWARLIRLAGTWAFGALPKRTLWFREPRIQHALNRLLATQRFDVVQVEDSAMGAYRYVTDAPTLFVEHEVRAPRALGWHSWRVAAGRRGWVGGAIEELDWRRWPAHQAGVWRRFDRVQLFTPRDAAVARRIAPELADRVRVNPFGIAIPPEAAAGAERPGTILFVGNFLHPPNVDAVRWLAGDIMPRLRARYPGVRLEVVGDDPRGLLCDIAAADVVLYGRVPEVESALERAAVVVAPVRTGGGQRMKVLHAMAAGKAVVTTTRGAEGLRHGPGPLPLSIADDADGIAAAIATLLASPNERQEQGRRARAYAAEHFSGEAYARRLDAIYAELCAERREREDGAPRASGRVAAGAHP